MFPPVKEYQSCLFQWLFKIQCCYFILTTYTCSCGCLQWVERSDQNIHLKKSFVEQHRHKILLHEAEGQGSLSGMGTWACLCVGSQWGIVPLLLCKLLPLLGVCVEVEAVLGGISLIPRVSLYTMSFQWRYGFTGPLRHPTWVQCLAFPGVF